MDKETLLRIWRNADDIDVIVHGAKKLTPKEVARISFLCDLIKAECKDLERVTEQK